MRTLIVTVGTSLLTNRDEGLEKRRPWAGWRPGEAPPGKKLLMDYLRRAEPQQASAETNTLRALPLQERDRLVFLHSQTPDGKRCAEALAQFYEERGYWAKLREIGGLGFPERRFQDFGLKALAAALFEEIEQAQAAGTPVFCATGGFKAEIALVNLVGMLMGIEVYYMHERFRELVRFPVFPVEWDLGVVERNLDFLEWIDSEPRRTAEVEHRLHNSPEMRPFVETDGDGCVYLSAAGDLLFKSYQTQAQAQPRVSWPEASSRPSREKKGLSGVEHERPEGWEAVVDWICEVDCVDRVSYDGRGAGRQNPGVYVRDAEKGVLQVIYKKGDRCLPLRLETRARGEAQSQQVADYIGRKLRRG